MHGNATLLFHPILVLTLVRRHFLIYVLILINLLEGHIHIEYEKHIQHKADTMYLTTLAPEAQRLLLKGRVLKDGKSQWIKECAGRLSSNNVRHYTFKMSVT